MLVPLSTHPALAQVNTDIFTFRYFAQCMACTFCHDTCCQYGCDVNVGERDRLLGLAPQLAAYVATPPEQWFGKEVFEDPEYPTGKFVRAQAIDGKCVFLNRNGRGCNLHRFALETGRDYHDVKPMVCWMFPVCWDKGVLRPNTEFYDGIICDNQGESLYQAARPELLHFFGAAVVAELDAVRAAADAARAP